jgi:hypothetical protein
MNLVIARTNASTGDGGAFSHAALDFSQQIANDACVLL